VPRITLFLGVLLALLGVIGYEVTGEGSITALIPAAFGLSFMILGLFGAVESLRKPMMHAAAALALLGVVLGLRRIVMAVVRGPEISSTFIEIAIFAGLCGLLLCLCVKSFVDARRQRMGEPGTMFDRRPAIPGAVLSLACSILGWLGGLVILVMAKRMDLFGTEGGPTSSYFVMLLVGLAAVVLWLIGLVGGIVVLRGNRRNGVEVRGRGFAWSAIMIGALPFVAFLSTFLLDIVVAFWTGRDWRR
jgi:hypothetical protein